MKNRNWPSTVDYRFQCAYACDYRDIKKSKNTVVQIFRGARTAVSTTPLPMTSGFHLSGNSGSCVGAVYVNPGP